MTGETWVMFVLGVLVGAALGLLVVSLYGSPF